MSDPTPAKIASDAVEHLANGADKVANAAGIVGQSVANQLGAIGRAMGKVAPEAWDILVRQQTVDGVVDVVMWFSAWATFFALLKLTRWLASKHGFEKNDSPTIALLPAIICGVLLAGQLIVGWWYIPTSIKQIANPKYYAAMELLAAAGAKP
jgi:hypothetical protein